MMRVFNFDDENTSSRNLKKKNRTIKIAIAAVIFALIPTVGSTLAASITLNSGSAVNFGQGISQATACDSAITVTPYSAFVNATGAGSFNMETITVSGIDQNACSGKTFKVNAFGDTSNTALTLSSGGTSSPACSASITMTSTTVTGVTSESSNTCVGSLSGGNLQFVLPGSGIAASTVYKLTVEEA